MSQDLHAFASRWFDDVWNHRIESTIDELMAPDCTGQMEGAPVRTAEEFKAQRKFLLGLFPDIQVRPEETVVEGNNVVTRWHATGTHSGSAPGLPATDAKVDFRGITWMKVEGGRMVQGWDSWNQGAVFEALRAKPGTSQSTDA